MRVIHNLHKEPAFDEKAGWTLKKWGFKTIWRTKGIPVEPLQELEHSRWYLQHKDGHVVTCQPKAWMDTGGFAMYTDTVLVPWWEKQKTSWSGEGPFPAKRLLVVCDNASVHKAEELREKLEQHGIILRFLPPNMTAWLQPLDLVVCGLIKTLQRARRGRHLARHLQAWKQKQDEIMGAALLTRQTLPPLEPEKQASLTGGAAEAR